MAKPQRMFVVTVLAVYMAATPTAWQPQSTIGSHEAMGLAAMALAIIIVGGLTTALRRLWRGANFLQRKERS
jgi:hypothetical protein